MDVRRLRGIGVSPGIAMGEALLAKRVVFTSRKEIIDEAQVPDEIKRLHQALDRTREDLAKVKEGVRAKMGPDSSLIFEAHLLILEDPSLVGGLESVIRDEKARSEWALSKTNARFEQLFESLTDEYFRQRKSDVSDVLKRVYRNLEARREKEDEIGLANGLAVTMFGGDLLTAEVTIVPGKGKLTLTGKLGEVMQESAQAAMSYLRSRAGTFGLSNDFQNKTDVHVHFPEGAIPKDGPSAGITMATAMASALLRIPVRQTIAMTGEVSIPAPVANAQAVRPVSASSARSRPTSCT